MAATNPVHRVLERLDDGTVLTRVVWIALRTIGVLALIGLVITGLLFLAATMVSRQPEAMVGGLLYALVTFAEGWVLFEVFRYRASNVKALGHSKFSVIPIASVLLRLIGEVLAVFFVTLGVGLLVLALFTGANAGRMSSLSPYLEPRSFSGYAMMGGFFGGVISLVTCLVVAFVALVFFYFFAECTAIAVEIANDVNALRSRETAPPAGPGPAAVVYPTLAPQPVSPSKGAIATCPTCESAIDQPDAVFCGNCGTVLRPGGSLSLR